MGSEFETYAQLRKQILEKGVQLASKRHELNIGLSVESCLTVIANGLVYIDFKRGKTITITLDDPTESNNASIDAFPQLVLDYRSILSQILFLLNDAEFGSLTDMEPVPKGLATKQLLIEWIREISDDAPTIQRSSFNSRGFQGIVGSRIANDIFGLFSVGDSRYLGFGLDAQKQMVEYLKPAFWQVIDKLTTPGTFANALFPDDPNRWIKVSLGDKGLKILKAVATQKHLADV